MQKSPQVWNLLRLSVGLADVLPTMSAHITEFFIAKVKDGKMDAVQAVEIFDDYTK